MTTKEKLLKVPAVSYYGTGKRKSAIARVWIFEGTGKVEVCGMTAQDYFGNIANLHRIDLPLSIVGLSKKFDIKITLIGGGKVGQCDACVLGIARALIQANSEFKDKLKPHGFLTRDSRVKERKKYGKRGARKSPQYRKR
jgi:small subunit ribosomal protein S9